MSINGSDEVGQGNLRRRTVVKGAAWSVPVIASAFAVPAASASSSETVIITPECGGHWRWWHDLPVNRNPMTASRSAYKLTITVQDGHGNPVSGATVTAISTKTQNDSPCGGRGGFSTLYFTGWDDQEGVKSERTGTQEVSVVSDADGDASLAVYTGRATLCPSNGHLRLYSGDFTVTVTYPDGKTAVQDVRYTLQNMMDIPTHCG